MGSLFIAELILLAFVVFVLSRFKRKKRKKRTIGDIARERQATIRRPSEPTLPPKAKPSAPEQYIPPVEQAETSQPQSSLFSMLAKAEPPTPAQYIPPVEQAETSQTPSSLFSMLAKAEPTTPAQYIPPVEQAAPVEAKPASSPAPPPVYPSTGGAAWTPKPATPAPTRVASAAPRSGIETIEITYRDEKGAVTKRRVVVYSVNSLYIVGFCLLRNEQRTFRVDRIQGSIICLSTAEILAPSEAWKIGIHRQQYQRTVFTGPRGGRYVIGPGGKKQYL